MKEFIGCVGIVVLEMENALKLLVEGCFVFRAEVWGNFILTGWLNVNYPYPGDSFVFLDKYGWANVHFVLLNVVPSRSFRNCSQYSHQKLSEMTAFMAIDVSFDGLIFCFGRDYVRELRKKWRWQSSSLIF